MNTRALTASGLTPSGQKQRGDAWGMTISLRAIVAGMIGIVFYAAFKGGYYFLANRLQEIGVLLSIILFFAAAVIAALNVKEKNLKWGFWFFSTLLFIGYTFIFPAYLFSTQIGVSMLPSVAASREFLIVFIGPAIYFLGRLGFDVDELLRIVMIALGLIVISYIFHYFRIDLEAANNSSDPVIKAMVTNDARGYRLKPPSVALFLVTIISAYLAFTETQKKLAIFWRITFLMAIYSWIILQARAPTAMLILGTMIYHFCFARKPRLGMLFLGLAFLVPVYPVLIDQYFEMSANADGGVRYNSYLIAFEVIRENPIFGLGQSSNFTKSEGDLFGKHFYSSDLGLVGVAFKFGILGAFFYIFFLIYGLVRAVKTNWLIFKNTGAVNIFLVASIVKLATDLLNSVLSYHYVQVHGVAHLSTVIAVTALYRLKYQSSVNPA